MWPPVPTCANCGQKVSQWEAWEDKLNDGYVMRVRCCGRTAVSVISHHDICDGVQVLPGVAFQSPELEMN